MDCHLCGGAGWCLSCDGFGHDKCELCENAGVCPDCRGAGKDTR